MKYKILFFIMGLIISLSACSTDEVAVFSGKEKLAHLESLSFDEFLDESYFTLIKCYPELVTELGMDSYLGTSGVELNSYNELYLQEIELLESGIFALLENYDKTKLNREQQISHSIYSAYLLDLINGQKFRHHSYLLSYMLNSVNVSTEQFFTEIIPVESKSDGEKYIQRLWAVSKKMEEVDSQIQIQEDKGIFLPANLIPPTLNAIRAISRKDGKYTDIYLSFKEKIEQMDLDQNEKVVLLEKAEEACRESLIPGYKILEKRLSSQQSKAGQHVGVSSLPDGEDYYSYTLAHHTNSNLNAEEIHNRGIEELDRIHSEMRSLFQKLDYDTGYDIETLYRKLERNDQTIRGSAIVDNHKSLIGEAKQWMIPYFSDFPKSELNVKEDDFGGFYIPPSSDGSRPGIFYASTGSISYFTLPTLTFHETYPGHHYQIALSGEMNLPYFQKQAMFTGFIEGWALYSEYFMARTGYYADDPFGQLGHLQAEAFRAARLVVDTGMHLYGWGINKAIDFFSENTGFGRGFSQNQIYRYLVWPGQATSYYTGFIEFRSLLASEEKRLGDKFDYSDFHNKLLAKGPMPLTLLKSEVFNIH